MVDSLREAREDANEAVETARRQAKDALRALREHDAALATHAEQLNRVTVRHESAVAECERLETGLAQAQAAVADAEAKATDAKAALDEAIATPRPVLDASARDGLLEALELAREENCGHVSRSRLCVSGCGLPRRGWRVSNGNANRSGMPRRKPHAVP